jgi:hypothetical protein
VIVDYLNQMSNFSAISWREQVIFTEIIMMCDKVSQLLAHGRWFSPGTPASSATKTGRHDIAEILLKVALKTKNQSINHSKYILKFSEMQLVNFITCGCESSAPFFAIYKAVREPTPY